MQGLTPVTHVMTKKPVTIAPEDNMEKVRKIFEDHGFHHLPVVSEGHLVGIVSYTDYLRIIRDLFDNPIEERTNAKLLNAMLAKDVMTSSVLCLGPHDTIEMALRIFKANQFHSMPVVDSHKKLLGIVTTYDLMKVLEHVFASESLHS